MLFYNEQMNHVQMLKFKQIGDDRKDPSFGYFPQQSASHEIKQAWITS